MIAKDDLRINGSLYFKEPRWTVLPEEYVVKFEDEGDPGRIALNLGLPFEVWKVVARFNRIVDPFTDIKAGDIIYVPTATMLSKIK